MRALGKKREMAEEEEVEIVCNSEQVRERFGGRERGRNGKARVCSNLVCVVLGEAPQHGWI